MRQLITRARHAPTRVRKRVGGFLIQQTFQQLANLGRLHPRARPAHHNVEVLRDIPYKTTGDAFHTLDIYRPTHIEPPWPVAFYAHGGAFSILSKDTHWLMGLAFARRGFLVVNINYRLAPRHPFPSGFEDCCDALEWAWDNVASYGGDRDRLVLAGESAGANLATSLAIATCYRHSQPAARRLFERDIRPRVVMAACGMFEVSRIDRFEANGKIPRVVLDRLVEVHDNYLGPCQVEDPAHLDFADPLVVFERGQAPDRPLPAFFLPVGTSDPLVYDNRRMATAMAAMGVDHLARYYPGELHAFHAFLWRPQARQCWRDWFEFVEERLGGQPSS